MEEDTHSLALINITFVVPSKVAVPEVPNHEIPHRPMPFLESSFIHSSNFLVHLLTSRLQNPLGLK